MARIQDGQNNCRLQSGLDSGTQEAVFCLQANAEKVYKFQIANMFLLQSFRFNFIKMICYGYHQVTFPNYKIYHCIKIPWPFSLLMLSLYPFTKRNIYYNMNYRALPWTPRLVNTAQAMNVFNDSKFRTDAACFPRDASSFKFPKVIQENDT
jgi:hypothetical protein